jgi:hypothetical protein
LFIAHHISLSKLIFMLTANFAASLLRRGAVHCSLWGPTLFGCQAHHPQRSIASRRLHPAAFSQFALSMASTPLLLEASGTSPPLPTPLEVCSSLLVKQVPVQVQVQVRVREHGRRGGTAGLANQEAFLAAHPPCLPTRPFCIQGHPHREIPAVHPNSLSSFPQAVFGPPFAA